MGVYTCKHFCLIWTLVLHADLSFESGTIGADPCPQSTRDLPVVDMCQTETRSEGQGTKNLLLQVNTTNDCSCLVKVMNAAERIGTTITRLGSTRNCGLNISMTLINASSGNEIRFLGNFSCSTPNKYARSLQVNPQEKIKLRSIPISQSNGVGYCLQIQKDATVGTTGTLQIACGTSNMATRYPEYDHATTTRTHEKRSSSVRTTEAPDKNLQTTFDIISTHSPHTTTLTENSFTVVQTKEGSEIYPMAIGITAGVLCIIIIVITVIICKRRKGKSHAELHMESRTLQSCPNDADDDYGLKYNVLYVSSDRQPDDTSPNVYETVD